MTKEKNRDRIARRILRVSKKLHGTPERPRVVVRRSNMYISAQALDDVAHVTLASSTSRGLKSKGATKSQVSHEAGKKLGEALKAKQVQAIVFDRRQYAYQGRVKQFADGIRAAGITF